MHSPSAFLAVAAAVTLTPGPAFVLVLQVAVAHGPRAALANIVGNSVGVLIWGLLSAAGVSALVTASQLTYELLRITGAVYLCYLGTRAVLTRRSPHRDVETGDDPAPSAETLRTARIAARKGTINSLANPKLAVFFVALFPQFLTPDAAVLPTAITMAGVIVVFDIIWYGGVVVLVGRLQRGLRPRLMRRLDQVSGAVLIALGLRLAIHTR